MKDKRLQLLLYSIFLFIVVLLSYYIVKDAYWLLGDDAIVINKTGFGHYFKFNDFVKPAIGRFYPFSYIPYNILVLLGCTSVKSHFALHCITFLLFSFSLVVLYFKITNTFKPNLWTFVVSISCILISIQRFYINFLDAYSTVWFVAFLLSIWLICSYMVHTKQNKIAAIIGLIVISILCYCSEIIFVIPLTYGILGILVVYKASSALERCYFLSMIFTAVVFLVIYYFVCYLHIENAYDGAHGTNVSLFQNAISMFIAQKVLWLGFVVLCVRIYKVLFNKESVVFWDLLILTGFAYCCGCAILRLNWTLYYSSASLVILPSVCYYLCKTIGEKYSAIILFCVALFMCRSTPQHIIEFQNRREESKKMLDLLYCVSGKSDQIFWYAPVCEDSDNFTCVLRDWTKNSVETLYKWRINDENYRINEINDYFDDKGTFIVSEYNDMLVPNSNEQILSRGKLLYHGNGIYITQIK